MAENPTPPPSSGANRSVIIATVVAVIAVMVALLAVVTRPSSTTTTPAVTTTVTQQADPAPTQDAAPLTPQQWDLMERRQDGEVTALGRVDAPVVLVEYSDYTCPFCGRFARETKPELVRRYVDAGVLRMEWRDYPVISENSPVAAAAGRAAGNQGKFWEFNAAVYQADLPGAELTADTLLEIAAGVGLDPERMRADMATPEVAQAVQKDYDEGRQFGITSTPTFFVNGTQLRGAQPLEVFEQVIDQHARAAAQGTGG